MVHMPNPDLSAGRNRDNKEFGPAASARQTHCCKMAVVKMSPASRYTPPPVQQKSIGRPSECKYPPTLSPSSRESLANRSLFAAGNPTT